MTVHFAKWLPIAALCALFACGKGKTADAPAPAVAVDPTKAADEKKPDKPAALPVAASAVQAEPEVPAGNVTLWHSYRDDEAKALNSLIEHWNGIHPKTQIIALAVPFDAFIDKVQVAVPNGNGPDILIMAHDKIGTWAREGILQPLGEFANPVRLQRFLPQTVKPLVFDRAIYGLPMAFKSLVLFYNKKMVKEPPHTLAQLIEIAKGFTNAEGGSFGLAYDASDLYFHAAFLHGAGGAVWDEVNKQLTINTPEAVKALEIARDLYATHKILPKGMSGYVITAMFNDGKTPFVFQGPWFISEIDKSVEWGVAPMPLLADGKPLKPYLGSEAVLLSKKTMAKDAALRVIDYLTSDEAALTRLEMGHQMVANTKIYENPRWLQNPVVKVFRAQADNAVPMSNAVEPGVAWVPYNNALRKVIFGDTPAADALAEADKQIREAVAKLGK